MMEVQCKLIVESHRLLEMPIKLSIIYVFGDNRVETTFTAEKSSFKRNTTNLWPEFVFFKQQPCDNGTEKENYPENTVLDINQAYQSY